MQRILATNVTLNRMKVTNNEKCTFCNTHSQTIPICFGVVILYTFLCVLMFETFVIEMCINMINMKLICTLYCLVMQKTLNQMKSLTLFVLCAVLLYTNVK